jgi:hypothetical protein
MRLTKQIALLVNRARSHFPDNLSPFVNDRIPVMSHPYTFVIESEAGNLGIPGTLLLNKNLSTDKPGLIDFDVIPETSITHPQAHFARHFIAMQGKTGFCSKGIASAEPGWFKTKLFADLRQGSPQSHGFIGMDEELESHSLTSIASSAYNKVIPSEHPLHQTCPG